MRKRQVRAIVFCVSAAVYGQPEAGPRFEVASVKPSSAESGSTSGIQTGHGRLDGHNVTLKRCIMGAYGVGPHQISGGPDWLDSDRFQILAKADRPVNDDAVIMVMLQDLLAERFKLKIHRETRNVAALILEVAKRGPKLEKAEAGESGTNTSSRNLDVTIDAHHTDMDMFAKVLAPSTEQPVINRTALEGIFNFKLHWTAGSEGPSLFTAIQEQLGLRLRAQKAPVEVVVIDRAEKPSEN